MATTLFIAPSRSHVGLVAACMGISHALQAQGLRVYTLNLLHQDKESSRQEATTEITLPFHAPQLQNMLVQHKGDDFISAVLERQAELAKEYDVILVKGIPQSSDIDVAEKLNLDLARSLAARVILVTVPYDDMPAFEDHLHMALQVYGGIENDLLLGVLVNKVGLNRSPQSSHIDLLSSPQDDQSFDDVKSLIEALPCFKKNSSKLLGMIPWQRDFYAPRTIDISDFLQAKVLRRGDIEKKRVHHVKLCARTVNHVLHVLRPHTLLITAGDRADILQAATIATLQGVNLAGLVMTGQYQLTEEMIDFCEEAFKAGLPLLSVTTDSYETASKLQHFNFKIPADDRQRIDLIGDYMLSHLAVDRFMQSIRAPKKTYMSPASFQYTLLAKAKNSLQTIVLPEGEEPRTIEAACYCAQHRIARLQLLGCEKNIHKYVSAHGLTMNELITVIDPESIREDYVAPLTEARRHKGVTEVVAREYLKSHIVLATMMLHEGQVDGLVSGAIHTTAHTIRPALQLIKTADEFNLVSSIFFMCLPEQVLVFGDCAINPDPTAEQLAEIAIQSADTAAAFSIEPRIAMLSYSTGTSGSGEDVNKVQKATDLVKKMRPDLEVDGPLQYDAAIIHSVAQQKAPQSAVAGRATVLIFPDLNSGNMAYKAVQRSADIVSIGPMLQGLRKPVNDLSRGASVKDIIYTIAMTAITAQDGASS